MLEQDITRDYMQAMKDRDTAKSSALSFLRAQIKNALIEKKAEKLEDADVITIIRKQVKQRQDSIEQFKQGGRSDLVDKETKELALLESYLPAQMSPEKVQELVDAAIEESGAAGMKDMGTVMKMVVEKAAGQADNKTVSMLVKQKLSRM